MAMGCSGWQYRYAIVFVNYLQLTTSMPWQIDSDNGQGFARMNVRVVDGTLTGSLDSEDLSSD